MAHESSRSRVTITLGRTGQVVKKVGFMSDGDLSDFMPIVGSKRPVRDRLGSNVGCSSVHESQIKNKRLRGDNNRAAMSANGLNDLHVGKGDLRLKIMQKNVSRRAQNDDQWDYIDLREKLLRTVRPPVTSTYLQHMPKRKGTSILEPTPFTINSDYLPRIDPPKNFCTPWTLEQLRRRSPERVLSTSRTVSSQRNRTELQEGALVRPFEDVRSVSCATKDADSLRSSHAASYMPKSTVPTGAVKPVAPVLTLVRPAGSIPQKNLYMSVELPSVDNFLNSLGLGKYTVLFKAEEVDMTALKQMGDHDLKELGIPMGPRKKILLALLPRPKRQTMRMNTID